jgi:hypothetical protein
MIDVESLDTLFNRMDRRNFGGWFEGNGIKVFQKEIYKVKTYFKRLVDLRHNPVSDLLFQSEDDAIKYFNKYKEVLGDDVLLVEEHRYFEAPVSALKLDGVVLSTIAQLCDRWFNHQVRTYDSTYGITNYTVKYDLFSLQVRCAMFSYALYNQDRWEEGTIKDTLDFNRNIPKHLDFKLIEGEENDWGYKETALPLGVALELNKLGGYKYWDVTDKDATPENFNPYDDDFKEIPLLYQWETGEYLNEVDDEFYTCYESSDMIERLQGIIENGVEEVNEDTLPRLIDALIDEHIEASYDYYFDGMVFWGEKELQSIFGDIPFPKAKEPYCGLTITIDKQNRESLESITMEDILQEVV